MDIFQCGSERETPLKELPPRLYSDQGWDEGCMFQMRVRHPSNLKTEHSFWMRRAICILPNFELRLIWVDFGFEHPFGAFIDLVNLTVKESA